MKKILILSYYFPPMGMGGTQRIMNFAKSLPGFGWQPYVVTVKDIVYHAHDPQLLQEISAINVTRTESLDPARLLARFSRGGGNNSAHAAAAGKIKKLIYRLISYLLIPDSKILWQPFALRAVNRLFRCEKFDLILSSGPPHSCHLLAYKITQKHKIPWIADFRDGWAGGDFQRNQSMPHRWFDCRLQKKIIGAATHITVVSEGLAQILAAERPQAVTVITNGYDDACFSAEYQPTSKFELVHSGSIGNFVNPDLLLRALQRFATEFGHETFHMRFIGADMSGVLQDKIAAAGLAASVESTGYLSHQTTVHALQKADLLIYLVSGGASKSFIPGKTFEYLAANRPVLAIAEDVEGTRLLLEGGMTKWVAADETEKIYAGLRIFYKEYLERQVHHADLHFTCEFEWKKLTAKLVKILAAVTNGAAAN